MLEYIDVHRCVYIYIQDNYTYIYTYIHMWYNTKVLHPTYIYIYIYIKWRWFFPRTLTGMASWPYQSGWAFSQRSASWWLPWISMGWWSRIVFRGWNQAEMMVIDGSCRHTFHVQWKNFKTWDWIRLKPYLNHPTKKVEARTCGDRHIDRSHISTHINHIYIYIISIYVYLNIHITYICIHLFPLA